MSIYTNSILPVDTQDEDYSEWAEWDDYMNENYPIDIPEEYDPAEYPCIREFDTCLERLNNLLGDK